MKYCDEIEDTNNKLTKRAKSNNNSNSNNNNNNNSNNNNSNNKLIKEDLFTFSSNVLKALFLLIIGITQDSVVGCNAKKLLNDSMVARHFIIFLAIWYGIEITSELSQHPLITLQKSLLLWGIFIMFIRTSLIFTLILFFMLFIILLAQTYLSYYGAVNKNNDHIKEIILTEKIYTSLLYSFGLVLVIGFVMYFMKQYKDHYDSFSFLVFIFGNIDCGHEK